MVRLRIFDAIARLSRRDGAGPTIRAIAAFTDLPRSQVETVVGHLRAAGFLCQTGQDTHSHTVHLCCGPSEDEVAAFREQLSARIHPGPAQAPADIASLFQHSSAVRARSIDLVRRCHELRARIARHDPERSAPPTLTDTFRAPPCGPVFGAESL